MVIQRWQSVFLLITAALMAVFTFSSLGQIQLPEYSLSFSTLGFNYEGIPTDGAPSGYEGNTWGFFIISLMCIILPIINIFCFKKLPLQKRLCLIELLLIVGTSITGAIIGYTQFDSASVSWSSTIIAPFLAIATDILAYIRISKDQRLLRSADRLR